MVEQAIHQTPVTSGAAQALGTPQSHEALEATGELQTTEEHGAPDKPGAPGT